MTSLSGYKFGPPREGLQPITGYSPISRGLSDRVEDVKQKGLFRNIGSLASDSFDNTRASLALYGAARGLVDKGTAAEYAAHVSSNQSDKPQELTEFTDTLREQGREFGEAEGAGKVYEAIEGVGQGLVEAITNPKGAAYFLAEQSANLLATHLPGLSLGKVAGAAGGLSGPVGAVVGGAGGYIAGSALGSFAIESGAEIHEAINELGGDPSNKNDVLKVLNDPAIMESIRIRGEKKGLPIALVDAVVNATVGKYVGGASTVKQAVKRGAVGQAAQITGAGVGEAAGQQWARGVIDYEDLALEVGGESVTGVVDTAASAYAMNKANKNSEQSENERLGKELGDIENREIYIHNRALEFTDSRTDEQKAEDNSRSQNDPNTIYAGQDFEEKVVQQLPQLEPEALIVSPDGAVGTAQDFMELQSQRDAMGLTEVQGANIKLQPLPEEKQLSIEQLPPDALYVMPDGSTGNRFDVEAYRKEKASLGKQEGMEPAVKGQEQTFDPVPDTNFQEELVPEKQDTLDAQVDAMKDGRKPAILITEGEPFPQDIPEGARIAKIEGRGLLIYNDDETLTLAKSGKMGEALGYGVDEKPQTDTVLTAKDEQGRIVADIATDGSQNVQQAAETLAGDSGTVESRPVDNAIAERLEKQTTGQESTLDKENIVSENNGLSDGVVTNIGSNQEAYKALKDQAYRGIDRNVFRDGVSERLQNDGQALLDALDRRDQEALNSLLNKHAQAASFGGKGAGPGKVRSGGNSVIGNFAREALHILNAENEKKPQEKTKEFDTQPESIASLDKSEEKQTEEREGSREIVEGIIKRRKAASEINKLDSYEKALDDAKSFMSGKDISPSKFTKAAKTFRNDAQLSSLYDGLAQQAKDAQKSNKAAEQASRESYLDRIQQANTEQELNKVSREIIDDQTLSDDVAIELDDAVMDAMDSAALLQSPDVAEVEAKIAAENKDKSQETGKVVTDNQTGERLREVNNRSGDTAVYKKRNKQLVSRADSEVTKSTDENQPDPFAELLVDDIEQHPNLKDASYVKQLEEVSKEAGWAERGGKMIKDINGDVTGRTKWLPKEAWFADKPDGVTEKDYKEAVTRIKEGRKLTMGQRKALSHMIDNLSAFEQSHVDHYDSTGIEAFDSLDPIEKDIIALAEQLDGITQGQGEALLEQAALQGLTNEQTRENIERALQDAQSVPSNEKGREESQGREKAEGVSGGVEENRQGAIKFSKAIDDADTETVDLARPKYSKANKNLFVIHNVSADNVLHARKMGGIAAPSVAVVHKDTGMDTFGEITLVGDASLIDPKEYKSAKVFNADIYSARYPHVEHKVSTKGLSEFTGRIQNPNGADWGWRGTYDLDESEIRKRGVEAIKDSPAAIYTYLKESGKRTPKTIFEKRPESDKVLVDYALSKNKMMDVVEVSDGFAPIRKDGSTYGRSYKTKEQARKAARDIFQKTKHQIDSYELAQDVEFQKLVVESNMRKYAGAPKEDVMRDLYAEEDGFTIANDAAKAVQRHLKPQEVDYNAMRDALRKRVEKDLAFGVWAKQQAAKIIEREVMRKETRSGKASWVPHTLENVVQEMSKSTRDSEGINYGTGNIRANAARQFRSIQQIKNNSGKLVTHEDMKAIKDEMSEEFSQIANDLKPFYKYESDSFGYYGEVVNNLGEAARGKGLADFTAVPRELKVSIDDFLFKLKNAETEYFEGKFNRAVDASEFSGAVVPRGTSKEVVSYLKDKGVPIRYYKRGDAQDRLRALNLFKKLMFSKGQSTGSTTEQISELARKRFKPLNKLMDSGEVKIVQSVKDLPKSLRSIGDNTIEGLFDGKTTYLVADSLDESNLDQVVMHEMAHRLFEMDSGVREKLIGRQGELTEIFNKTKDGTLKGRYKSFYEKVMKRIPDDTPQSDIIEEFAAYTLTEYNKGRSLPTKLKQWAQSIMAMFRQALRKIGFNMNFTPADLQLLVKQSMKRVNLESQPETALLSKAQSEGYKGEDMGEAKEWLRAKAKGLDMSKEARMQRARDMGFDTDQVYYHGTPSSFDAFREGYGGVYFTDSSAYADRYTVRDGESGRNIIPVHLKLDETFDTRKPEHRKIYEEKFLNRYGNGTPLREDGLPDWVEADDFQDFFEQENLTFDSAIVGEPPTTLRDGSFRPEKSLLVTNEKNIRSINAAFDPDYSDSPNLLASKVKFSTVSPVDGEAIRSSISDRLSGLKDKLDTFRYYAQDKNIDVKRVQEALGDLPDAQNPYQKIEIWEGIAGERLNDFDEDYVQPLKEAIAATQMSLDEVGKWLVARHAEEANAYLASINPDKPAAERNRLSGMSNQEANAILSANRGNRELDYVGELVDIVNREKLDLLLGEGLISRDEAAQWRSRYEKYVPLFRDDVDKMVGNGRGQGFNIKGKESKARTGNAHLEPTNIVAHVLEQYEHAIVRAEKNKVGKAVLDMAEANPDESWWSIDRQKTVKSVRNGKVVENTDPREADNELNVKVNGKTHTITFNEKNKRALRMARGLKNLDAPKLGGAMKYLQLYNRLLSSLNTSWSPEFLVTNFFRDVQTAGYNLSSTEIDSSTKEVLKNIPKAIKGIHSQLRGDGNSEWAEVYEDFRKHGGKTGWIDTHKDILDRGRKLQKEIDRLADGKPDKTVFTRVAGLVDDYNTVIENGVRLSAYKSAVDRGISKEKAAAIAKGLTVNFNKKGSAGPVMNALYLFYNASIQGNVRLIQTLVKSRKARGYAAATVGLAVALDIMNHALSGEDDDGENIYDNIDEYTKSHNIIIMGEDEPIVKLPTPWGYNVLHVIGQSASRMVRDETYSMLDALSDTFTATLDAFNPVSSGSMMQTLSPTITDMAVQIAENKDYAGRPLKPEGYNRRSPEPEYQMHWKSATAFSQWATEELNKLSGGNEVRPGAVNWSPEWLDLFISNFTGAAGRFYWDTSSAAIKVSQGDEVESKEIPFWRKVHGYNTQYGIKSRYYDWSTDIAYTKSELKRLRGEERREVAESDQARLVGIYSRTEKVLRKLRKLRKASEDQEQIEILDEKMRREMAKFNRSYARIVLRNNTNPQSDQ